MVSSAIAKDFGVQGHTALIIEEDILDLLIRRLGILQLNGTLQEDQEILRSKAIERIKSPLRVEGIERTKKYKRFTFDPTITVPDDIKDHQEALIHKAGTRLNPLHHMPFNQIWFFIEGDDPRQVAWALSQVKEEEENSSKIILAKIILVSGSPFDLSEHHGYRFYFDQLGKLSSHFNIKRVPSKLSRHDHDLLLIEEMPVLIEPSTLLGSKQGIKAGESHEE